MIPLIQDLLEIVVGGSIFTPFEEDLELEVDGMVNFLYLNYLQMDICKMLMTTKRTFIKVMEMLTGTGTRVRLEGLTVVIGGISFLRIVFIKQINDYKAFKLGGMFHLTSSSIIRMVTMELHDGVPQYE